MHPGVENDPKHAGTRRSNISLMIYHKREECFPRRILHLHLPAGIGAEPQIQPCNVKISAIER